MQLFGPPNVWKLERKKNVKGLIKALKYFELNYVRIAAAEALVKLGSLAVEPLIRTLDDGHSSTRQTVAEILGKLGDTRAVGPLIERLQDEEWYVRQAAAEALGKLGDARAVQPLIEAMEAVGHALLLREQAKALFLNQLVADLMPPERLEALRRAAVLVSAGELVGLGRTTAEALGKLGDARAVQPLIGRLSGADVGVREAAAEALGKLGDARAVQPLIGRLSGADVGVREAAAEALGKLGDARAVQPLIEAPHSLKAAEALVKLGDARGVQRLIEILRTENQFVREAAVEALGKLGDARAVEPLIEALFDRKLGPWKPYDYANDGRVRGAAAEALGRLGDRRAVQPLIRALGGRYAPTTKGGDVRQSAAAALEKLGEPRWNRITTSDFEKDLASLGKSSDPRAVEPLIETLQDAAYDVLSKAAAEALGNLGDPRAVEPLINTLAITNKKAWAVRKAAAAALIAMVSKMPSMSIPNRSTVGRLITAPHHDSHEDRSLNQSSDCRHVDHHEDQGIGLDGPRAVLGTDF
jgi:HEAT repeat protein